MKRVAILLAPGFEEAEAIVTIDVLRRLELDVHVLSCSEDMMVVSYHGIAIVADSFLNNELNNLYDAVVLPGGPNGSAFLSKSKSVIDFIRNHDIHNKLICVICSAAARVLGDNKLLKGRKYVCSGEYWKYIDDGIYVDESIVMDKNLLSGKGLGNVFDFSFYIAWQLLEDKNIVKEQAAHIYYQWH